MLIRRIGRLAVDFQEPLWFFRLSGTITTTTYAFDVDGFLFFTNHQMLILFNIKLL
jgi:hypothetical protein